MPSPGAAAAVAATAAVIAPASATGPARQPSTDHATPSSAGGSDEVKSGGAMPGGSSAAAPKTETAPSGTRSSDAAAPTPSAGGAGASSVGAAGAIGAASAGGTTDGGGGGRESGRSLSPDGAYRPLEPPSYEYANSMYPTVARRLRELPTGGLDGSGRHSLGSGDDSPGAALGMRQLPPVPSDVHVDALRPRKSESKPLDKRAALEANMRARGFKIVDVPGDNNCQFHAVADQLEQVMIDSRKAHEMKFFERSFA